MSLIQAIKTQIQSLIDRANEKTGKTDADLTSAVNSLIESGGSGGFSSGLDELIKTDFIDINTGLATELSETLWSGNPSRRNCTLLYFPNITIVKEKTFSNAKIGVVNLPKVTTIEAESFYACEGLYDVTLENVTNIGECAFQLCYHLETLYIPNVINIGNYAFDDCEDLSSSLVLPKCETIGEYAFRETRHLGTVDLSSIKTIGEGAFSWIGGTEQNLKSLLLRSEEMCEMNITAIIGTAIVNSEGMPTGYGFVYVPSALYENYLTDFAVKVVELATTTGTPMDEPTATYMATLILRKLEDYTVDGTTTGELDETKI